jgi:hypothetical protein
MSDQTVQITVSLPTEAAYQLAQFAKRCTFNTFYESTEAHLSDAERKTRAYQMIDGIEAIRGALANAGCAPR